SPALPTRPICEAMWMMLPPPAALMRGMACLLIWKAPPMLTASARSQSASSSSAIVAFGGKTAALLTRICRAPNRSAAAATAARAESLRLTSHARPIAVPPAAVMEAAVAAASPPSMSAQRSLAPSAAKAALMAEPMPPPAPVTMATFPCRRPLVMVVAYTIGAAHSSDGPCPRRASLSNVARGVERRMLLSVQDLSVRFKTEDGTVHAVNGVSFDLDASETLGIVGESGCGKSATSLAITRLLPRTHATIAGGRILFRDVDLIQLPDREMRKLRGRDIAIVFQDPMTSLNPVLTIGRQLTEALCAHEALPKHDAAARAVALLQTVGIPAPAATLRRYPHQLSGGMRQRVMIAMALA